MELLLLLLLLTHVCLATLRRGCDSARVLTSRAFDELPLLLLLLLPLLLGLLFCFFVLCGLLQAVGKKGRVVMCL